MCQTSGTLCDGRSLLLLLTLTWLTCLRHALRSLHPGAQNLFGRDEEDPPWSLVQTHHLQLLGQETHTAVQVLLPHLDSSRRTHRLHSSPSSPDHVHPQSWTTAKSEPDQSWISISTESKLM